jgi:hypothetical protein
MDTSWMTGWTDHPGIQDCRSQIRDHERACDAVSGDDQRDGFEANVLVTNNTAAVMTRTASPNRKRVVARCSGRTIQKPCARTLGQSNYCDQNRTPIAMWPTASARIIAAIQD